MIESSEKMTAMNDNRLPRCPTGIIGLDQITEGGLPKNMTTLVCGAAGSGKTIFGLDFLINGALTYNEAGIFVSFEETEDELYRDVASLNLDLKGLVSQKKIVLHCISLERKDIQDKNFNLEGLFVLLDQTIHAIGAKRIVIDSVESLFADVVDRENLRSEIKRLFRWLKERNVTAFITGEPYQGAYTRRGLEEYISDCIISLDNRVVEQIAIRRIRIVKYRGSNHGTNEYPFIISNDGLSVIPITSAGLDNPGTSERVSTGIPTLDDMFYGGGYTKGSTVLLSGTAGTGKTSIAIAYALSVCSRGERCLFLSYEESTGQLIENMKSIGFNCGPFIQQGLLKMVSTRPTFFGLEKHLLDLRQTIEAFSPQSVVIDPLTSLLSEGSTHEIQSMVTRMIDLLKSRGVTGLFTSLVSARDSKLSSGEIGVSSLIDTWIVVRELEGDAVGINKRRIRGLYIVKSRGMGHSNDVRKLVLSNEGITITSTDTSEGSAVSKNDSERQ